MTEAYYNEMGSQFGEKVRDRIHWICEQAKGEKILDVGCSQGITSILLGREGKQVLGIDLLQESIDFAKQALEKEEEITQKYVDFVAANFMDYDFQDEKFDSIIFGEILEHVSDPGRFITKASTLLSENGQIIVTVPFGINDYFDHKKTYYLKGLLDLQIDSLLIKDIEFFGKWIGITLIPKSEKTDSIEMDSILLKRLESSFYDIERDLLERLANSKQQYTMLQKTNSETNEKLKKATNEIDRLKTDLEELNNKIAYIKEVNKNLKLSLSETENDYKNLKTEFDSTKEELNDKLIEIKEKELILNNLTFKLEESKKSNEFLQKEKSELEQKIKDLMNEINDQNNQALEEQLKKDRRIAYLEKKVTEFRKKDRKQQAEIKKLQKQDPKVDKTQLVLLQKEILKEKKKKLKSDELLLEAYKKEERLLKSYSYLLNRYEALKTSKLGGLTIKYWKWRSKRFGGKK